MKGCTCAAWAAALDVPGICPRCHTGACPAARNHFAACVAEGSLGLKAGDLPDRSETFGTWATDGTASPDGSRPLSH